MHAVAAPAALSQRPVRSIDDLGNCRRMDAVFSRQSSLGQSAIQVLKLDQAGCPSVKPSCMVRGATASPIPPSVLLNGVNNVVMIRTNEQMIRVNASRNIASMADQGILREFSEVDFVRESMNQEHATSASALRSCVQESVALVVLVASPDPAAISFRDVAPQALSGGFPLWPQRTGIRCNIETHPDLPCRGATPEGVHSAARVFASPNYSILARTEAA